jgi:hypothetical protein
MHIIVLLLLVLVSSPCFGQTLNESPDQIWNVGDRRWTLEQERVFEKWVEETITEDFFVRHRIPTDCADAVIAIRWIYARMARLPAAATTVDGRRIGHWSTDWKHLPTHPDWDKDDRFLAALFHLFPRTWTGTLPFDTYPVRVSPDSIRPGTLFLVTESHTGIIGHVSLDGSQPHPLQTWESALPVKIQKLNLRYFFSGRPDVRTRSGLVRFRWPVHENGEWKYLPVKEHPFYSEEQYGSDFCNGYADFVEAVAKRIDPADHDPSEKITRVLGTIIGLLRERIPLVLAGHEQCRNGDCPEASELWEYHSTAGRDETLVLLMDHLSKLIERDPLGPGRVNKLMEAVPIEISENRTLTLYGVCQNHLWFSADPEDSIEARWGLKKCEMIYARTDTTKASIAFIEKTYRKRDPRYADFSIMHQRETLRKLGAEWTRFECSEALLRPEVKTHRSVRPVSAVWDRSVPRACGVIRAEMRATDDSMAFIERTYRSKDPEYADFSMAHQQEMLRRLREEWTRSGCSETPLFPVEKARPSPRPVRTVEVPPPSGKCEGLRTEILAANDSIAFIDKTYRGKDPEYADYSIAQQQELLRRLNEQWAQAGCREIPPAATKKRASAIRK